MKRLALAITLIAFASPAFAQTSPPKLSRIELGGAFTWTGSASLGDGQASLSKPDNSPLPLFSTVSSIAAGGGFEAHLTCRVTRHLRAEATGSWLHPALRTRVSGDIEGADGATLTQGVSEFSVEGGGLWVFRDHRRIEPFARGSVGWMRQLTADRVLFEDGVIFHAGGGVVYWLRDSPTHRISRFGIRVEGRATMRSGGLALTNVTHQWAPTFSVGATMGF